MSLDHYTPLIIIAATCCVTISFIDCFHCLPFFHSNSFLLVFLLRLYSSLLLFPRLLSSQLSLPLFQSIFSFSPSLPFSTIVLFGFHQLVVVHYLIEPQFRRSFPIFQPVGFHGFYIIGDTVSYLEVSIELGSRQFIKNYGTIFFRTIRSLCYWFIQNTWRNDWKGKFTWLKCNGTGIMEGNKRSDSNYRPSCVKCRMFITIIAVSALLLLLSSYSIWFYIVYFWDGAGAKSLSLICALPCISESLCIRTCIQIVGSLSFWLLSVYSASRIELSNWKKNNVGILE